MYLDILNKALESDYISDEYNLDDLKFISDLVDIILSANISYDVPIYKCPVTLDTSLEYSKKFLNTLDRRYTQELEVAINNGYVIFNCVNDFYEVSKTISDGKYKYIEYNMTGYIFDAYSIVHELIHYTSLDIKNKKLNWDLTTEAYAFVAESLLKDYLKNNCDNSEYNLNDISNLLGVLEKAMMLDFEIKLMKKYLKNKSIEEQDLLDIFKDKPDGYIEYSLLNMECIIENYKLSGKIEFNFSKLQNYIIGYILSTHILSNIRYDKKYINDYLYLVNNSNNMNFLDTLERLDLEVIDKEKIILSDNSLKILKKEYKKRVDEI